MARKNNAVHEFGLMSSSKLENEIIKCALEGDADEGAELLRRCHVALVIERFSPALRSYLADRIKELIAGVEPREALRIKRKSGGQRVTAKEWDIRLVSFGEWLIKDGLCVAEALEAMIGARLTLNKCGLDVREAKRIRAELSLVRDCAMDDLLEMMHNYAPLLAKYRKKPK